MTNLFEYYEMQPSNLKAIVDKYMAIEDSSGFTHEILKQFEKEVNEIGFTFDYGLDMCPYDLRLIETKN